MTPPTEDAVTRSHQMLVLDLEARTHQAGWDQPAKLFEVKFSEIEDEERALLEDYMKEHHGLAETITDRDPTQALEMFAQKVELEEVPLQTPELEATLGVRGHVLDYLEGRHADNDAVGAGLILEGWAYSDETVTRLEAGEEVDYMPSEDPGRVECRQVVMVIKDGEVVSCTRRRGDTEATLIDGGTIEGRVVDTLRRYLNLPTRTPDRQLRETAAALTLMVGIEAALTAKGAVPKEGHPELIEPDSPAEATLIRLVGAGPAAVICWSRHTPDWEAAARLAAGQIDEAIARLKLGSVEESAEETQQRLQYLEWWRRRLRWFDAGLIAAQYANIPPVEAVRGLCDSITQVGLIDTDTRDVLTVLSRMVEEHGWGAETP